MTGHIAVVGPQLKIRGSVTISIAQREDTALADDISKAKSATQQVRAQQAEDGRKAMAEYTASAAAMRAKTEKLRA